MKLIIKLVNVIIKIQVIIYIFLIYIPLIILKYIIRNIDSEQLLYIYTIWYIWYISNYKSKNLSKNLSRIFCKYLKN